MLNNQDCDFGVFVFMTPGTTLDTSGRSWVDPGYVVDFGLAHDSRFW